MRKERTEKSKKMAKKKERSKEEWAKDIIEANKAFQGQSADLPPEWLERIERINEAWGTPPEERRQPLLDALKECWDLAPSMRLTQLLINAKVFPSGPNDNWGVFDEETTKKLKKFTRYLKKQRKEWEKEKKKRSTRTQ